MAIPIPPPAFPSSDAFPIPMDIPKEATNFEGKNVIYLEASEPLMSRAQLEQLEYAMNMREFRSHSDVRYRIMPFGLKIQNKSQVNEFIPKAIVRCLYCGSFGARYCKCIRCGADIE